MAFHGNTQIPRLLVVILSMAFLSFFAASIEAQTTANDGPPKVFLDCQTHCFWDHIRSELSYLNFMRDRQNADVYLLLTSLRTGAAGREWTLTLKGFDRFEGMTDTLVFYTDSDATDGQIQDLQVEKIQLVLLPFILKTSLASRVEVSVRRDSSGNNATPPEADPWNYWVFSIGGNLNLGGEESFANLHARGRFHANRVTDNDKFSFSANYNYSRNRFTLEDGSDFISITRRFDSWTLYVHSISNHWSAGGFGNVFSSTVSNIDFSASLRPAIEYNVFPYAEATKRQFTFLYNIGPFYNNYTDTTIFDVVEEWYVRQSMDVNFRQIEEWGTLDIGAEFANYMHDFSLFSLSFNPQIEWNIFRGFNLWLGGNISMVRDQINIRKGEASNEEVLLQLTELSTNYEYGGYVGINYRFGSQVNNIVNTRF